LGPDASACNPQRLVEFRNVKLKPLYLTSPSTAKTVGLEALCDQKSVFRITPRLSERQGRSGIGKLDNTVTLRSR